MAASAAFPHFVLRRQFPYIYSSPFFPQRFCVYGSGAALPDTVCRPFSFFKGCLACYYEHEEIPISVAYMQLRDKHRGNHRFFSCTKKLASRKQVA